MLGLGAPAHPILLPETHGCLGADALPALGSPHSLLLYPPLMATAPGTLTSPIMLLGPLPQDPSMGSWSLYMAVYRRCSGSQPSRFYGNSSDSCMNQSMTARRPYAATTGPFATEEASLNWGPELADCSRPSSGTFMLVPVSTEPRSCLPWSKYGICCTLSTNETMGLSEGALQ